MAGLTGNIIQTKRSRKQYMSHQHFANSGSPQTFTIPAGASGCDITVSTGPLAVTFDGSTPSNVNGLQVPAGYWPDFIANAPDMLTAFKGLTVGGTADIAFFSEQ